MDPVVTQPTTYPVNPTSEGHDGGPVTIQLMTAEDAQLVSQLTFEAFEAKLRWCTLDRDIPFVIRGLEESYRNSPSEYHRHFIALYEGQKAGYVALKYHDSSDYQNSFNGLSCRAFCGFMCFELALGEKVPSRKCYVDHIGVSADFRGKGIGKALMERADHEARLKKCDKIYLHVTSDNRARNLYERLGYKIVRSKGGSKCNLVYCSSGVQTFYEMEKSL